MNQLFLTTCLVFSFTFSAQAGTVSERIRLAAEILGGIAEESQTFQVQPQQDPKAMLLEFALKEKLVESKEDFESNWVGDQDEAWGGDSMLWGVDDLLGAEDYVVRNLEQRLEEGEQTDQDKIKYADAMLEAKRAISILRPIKSVRFGVIPTGAVQCGFTFASLLIIDMQSGEMHQIVMEGSGC